MTWIRDLWVDWRYRVRYDGWRQASRWLAGRIVSLPYRKREFLVLTRSLQTLPAVPPPARPVTLRRAEPADLALFQGVIPPSELGHARQRLAHGHHCFLALDGDRLAAYCWATTRIDPSMGYLQLPLQPGDAYLDDAYTIPAYRRQGIQMAVHRYRLAYMQQQGCRRAILLIEPDNTASLQLAQRLGYRQVSRLTFRRILWKRTFYYHDGGVLDFGQVDEYRLRKSSAGHFRR